METNEHCSDEGCDAAQVRAWLCWWLIGYSVQTVIFNYFQLQLAEVTVSSNSTPANHTPAPFHL